jgi:hypothetical protein
MRIDTFGLPVPVKYQEKVKKRIPLSFRRPNKAEAREQEMENLRKACGCRTITDKKIEEMAPRIWKNYLRRPSRKKDEEKEK